MKILVLNGSPRPNGDTEKVNYPRQKSRACENESGVD